MTPFKRYLFILLIGSCNNVSDTPIIVENALSDSTNNQAANLFSVRVNQLIDSLKNYSYQVYALNPDGIPRICNGVIIKVNQDTCLLTSLHTVVEFDTANGYIAKPNGLNFRLCIKPKKNINVPQNEWTYIDIDTNYWKKKFSEPRKVGFPDWFAIKIRQQFKEKMNFLDFSKLLVGHCFRKKDSFTYILGSNSEDLYSTRVDALIGNIYIDDKYRDSYVYFYPPGKPGFSGSPVFSFYSELGLVYPVFLGMYHGTLGDTAGGTHDFIGSAAKCNELVDLYDSCRDRN